MVQITIAELKTTYSEKQLFDLLDALDQLHSAVSEGQTAQTTLLNKRELLAYLRDVIYTAQETITELDKEVCYRQTSLRLVEKSTA